VRRRGVGDRWSVVRDALSVQLWPLPALAVVAALGAGVGLPQLDRWLDERMPAWFAVWLFSGGADAARSVIAAVASSIITVTALTFSLTVVTLQLASSQYSPRILRTFTRDKVVHVTLALMVATFVYALTILRTVRAPVDGPEVVPRLSVTVAYLLALASVIALVLFLAHLARQIRVEAVVRDVHAETSATMQRTTNDHDAAAATQPNPPSWPTLNVCLGSSGFITSIDEAELLTAAESVDALLVLDVMPGDSVVAGTPVATAFNAADHAPMSQRALSDLTRRVNGAVDTGFEPTAAQDISFGFRQLVDVTLRALSPGINDPTTAVHTLGHLSALLCEAASRDLDPQYLRDDRGRLRVVLPRPNLAMLLDLAVSQPLRHGASEPAIAARLLQLLRELAWNTNRPVHHDAIAKQLRRLRTAVSASTFDDHDRVRLSTAADLVDQALQHTWPATRAEHSPGLSAN
jgi:uncharacterized membrane protein